MYVWFLLTFSQQSISWACFCSWPIYGPNARQKHGWIATHMSNSNDLKHSMTTCMECNTERKLVLLLEITSSKSIVLSLPAALRRSSLPPGWNLKYGVMLYTWPMGWGVIQCTYIYNRYVWQASAGVLPRIQVHASSIVQCLASSSSVTVSTSPLVPAMSFEFLQSLIQSSMPQPGPRLTRCLEDLPAGSDTALLKAGTAAGLWWVGVREVRWFVDGAVRLCPGAESVCFLCGDGEDRGEDGVSRVFGLMLTLDAAAVGLPGVLLPGRKTWDMFLRKFLLWVSFLLDSKANGDIGGDSVTILGGGSFSAGNGALQMSMAAWYQWRKTSKE